MESRLYFSAFVLIMCAVHLVWTASAWMNARWQKNVPHSNKRIAMIKNSNGILQKAHTPKRSDWYVFFHCSDLVGRESAIPSISSINRNKTVADLKIRGGRRANA